MASRPGTIVERAARRLVSFFVEERPGAVTGPAAGGPDGWASLNGRVVVITGAARGLGAALARNLAGRGARLALLGLEPAELAKVADDCGERAAWWEVDVTDSAELDKVALGVVEHFGSVDAVVANAGIAGGGPLVLAEPASFDRIIEVNLLGSVRTGRAFMPFLYANGGYFLQIASLAAVVHAPLMGAYSASKAGVEAFANSLRAEAAGHGVAVGVAYLSWTDTDMVRGADEVSGLGPMRASLPFPFNRTGRVDVAAERLAAGIGRRAARIYVPRWVLGAVLTRGTSPMTVQAFGRRRVVEAEEELRAAGPEATRPVGAGGQADRAYRPRP